MKCRKAFGDMRLQAMQGFRVLFGVEKIRDGLEGDRLAQSGSRGLLIDGYARYRGDLNLARAVRESIQQQHADRPHAHHCARNDRAGIGDQNVARIAVARQRMRNEPVIAGIAHGGIEKPVDDKRAGVLVHLVFDRLAADRHLDDDVDLARRIDPDRNGVNAHGWLREALELRL